jgi:hypothetical protein
VEHCQKLSYSKKKYFPVDFHNRPSTILREPSQ